MLSRLRVLVAVLAMSSSVAFADESLAQTYKITAGEVLALRIQMLLSLKLDASFDAPVAVLYDTEKNKMVFTIFGSRTGTDEAKASMDNFRKLYLGGLTTNPPMKGVKLAEKDTVIRYVNKTSMKMILEHADGQYVMK